MTAAGWGSSGRGIVVEGGRCNGTSATSAVRRWSDQAAAEEVVVLPTGVGVRGASNGRAMQTRLLAAVIAIVITHGGGGHECLVLAQGAGLQAQLPCQLFGLHVPSRQSCGDISTGLGNVQPCA